MIRRSVSSLPVVALALICAACASSGGDDERTAPSGVRSSASSAPQSSSIASTPVTQPKSVPASVPNSAGVIKNKLVSLTSCRATIGGWEASGTARSRADRTTAYTVTIFFTTNSATVQAYGQTKVTAPKGKTAGWTVTSKFVAAPGTLCVLRGAG